jgi:hypothetical protein
MSPTEPELMRPEVARISPMGIKPEGNCLRFSNHGSVDFLGKTLLVVLPKTRRVFLKKRMVLDGFL